MYLFSRQNIPSNTTTIYIYWSLSHSGRNIPSNTKYNTHWLLFTNSLLLCCINFPAGVFRPIQIQYTFIVVVLYQLSGRNIPSNTNTIHIHCCCVVSNFPAGIFSQIQIQYTCIVHSYFPAGIFRPIQIQYIYIHCCCVCVVSTFRPE